MADYKAMYYHLAGRMASAIDTLEATTNILEATTNTLVTTTESLVAIKEKLKLAQQTAEDMFISCDDEDGSTNIL